MPNPYFSNLGDFLYVNRTREGRSEGDYSLVKNLFKTGNIEGVLKRDFYGNTLKKIRRMNIRIK